MEKNRECVICGKEFTKNGKTLTCSKECAEEYRKRYNKNYMKKMRGCVDLKIKRCPVCGKKFKQIRGNQVVCSSECRAKRKKEMDRKNTEIYRKENRKKTQRNKQESIMQIDKKAKEAGMSYGKYVAMMERR